MLKAISELITEKEKDLNIQRSKAIFMTPDTLEWVRAKEFINNIPSNYRDVVNEALEKKTFEVDKFHFGENTIIELKKYMGKIRIILEMLENENKAMQRVIYFAFNREENKVYCREIIGQLFIKKEK